MCRGAALAATGAARSHARAGAHMAWRGGRRLARRDGHPPGFEVDPRPVCALKRPPPTSRAPTESRPDGRITPPRTPLLESWDPRVVSARLPQALSPGREGWPLRKPSLSNTPLQELGTVPAIPNSQICFLKFVSEIF